MDKIVRIALSLFLITLLSCSQQAEVEIPGHLQEMDNLTVYPPSGDEITENGLTLIREVTFGETEDLFIRSIGQTAVDETGRVFLSDPGESQIHVYNPDGEYLSTIGRQGSGPGEYQNIIQMKIYSGHLYVQDNANQKIDAYSLSTLSLDHTLSLNPDHWGDVDELDNTWPVDFFEREDGTFLVRFMETPGLNNPDSKMVRYFVLERDGRLREPVTMIFEQKDTEHINYRDPAGFIMFYQAPPAPGPLAAVDARGRIFAASSAEFLISTYTPEGEYQEAFYHPYANEPLDETEFVNRFEGPFRNAALEADLPESWPALNSIIVDDENRLWVSTIIEDQERYNWWLLRENGERIATFTRPRNQPIQAVRNGYLYSRETDEETGLQELVRYRIELES